MRPHFWTRIYVSSVAFAIIVIVTTNYFVNPYNLFYPNPHTQYNRLKKDIISERMTYFYEMQYIRPQTLMVGTSRIGYFKSYTLKPYAPSPIFNLTLAGSSVYEQRRYIQYAIEHLPVKTIVWSLDFFSFNPIKQPYPSFSEDRLKHSIYLDDYLISLFSYRTFERSLKTLKINHREGPFDDNVSAYYEPHHYMDVQGQTLSYEEVRKNANWTLNEYADHEAFLKPAEFRNPQAITPKLAEVAYIINLCKEKHIRCLIYTSPVYREHLDMIYKLGLGDTYEYWKKGLAHITDYWDFNTYNSLTENLMNFRDSSHMVSDNGKFIFTRLFNAVPYLGPADFGYYATQENIDSHIKEQRRFIHPFVFHKEYPDSMKSAE